MPRLNSARELEHLREQLRDRRKNINTKVMVCGGTGCQASDSLAVVAAVREELSRQGLDKSVCLCVTGCHGFCEQGPVMVIEPGDIFYCHVSPEDAFEIVYQTVLHGKLIERLLYVDPVSGRPARTESEIPFYRAQDRQILSQHRMIDPCSIEDYIVAGGYSALVRVVSNGMTPEKIIDEITTCGLRGRGGGGFPTGRKWRECREAPGDEKYVICNADEGDPGAYMDRCVLEGNPHLVLEGMMVGARAVGASRGYIYVRNEYPLAVEHSRMAVAQARELGLLGNNILGSSFSFDVDIARGGGAFVCGESTALMASVEGKVGEPRAKDVHTVVDGLYHKPTTLNNVETWANVPGIILNGASWFASKGTARSKGTKILALTGRIKNTGLVEVAMGMPIREVVFDIGGGAVDGTAGQGRPDRRAIGRLPAARKVRPSHRFRRARRGRLDGRLGRHGRHGRKLLHGGCRQVFPQFPPGRILRQVRALPAGGRPDAGDNHRHHRRPRQARSSLTSSRSWPIPFRRRPYAGWARPRPTRC